MQRHQGWLCFFLINIFFLCSLGCPSKQRKPEKRRTPQAKVATQEQMKRWLDSLPQAPSACHQVSFKRTAALFRKAGPHAKSFLIQELQQANQDKIPALLYLLRVLRWQPERVVKILLRHIKSPYRYLIYQSAVNYLRHVASFGKGSLRPLIREAKQSRYAWLLLFSSISHFSPSLLSLFLAKADQKDYHSWSVSVLQSKWPLSKSLLKPLSDRFRRQTGQQKKWASIALTLQGPRAGHLIQPLVRYACNGQHRGGHLFVALGVNALLYIQQKYLKGQCRYPDFMNRLFFLTLGPEGRFVLPLLSTVARQKNVRRASAAISALGRTGDPKAIPILLTLAKLYHRQGRPSLLNDTIEALGRFGPKAAEAMPTLIKVLKSPTGKRHRFEIFRSIALIKTGVAQAIPHLLRSFLKHKANFAEASRALAELTGKVPIPIKPLKRAMRHQSAEVRLHATLLLYKLGYTKETVPILRQILTFKDSMREGNPDARQTLIFFLTDCSKQQIKPFLAQLVKLLRQKKLYFMTRIHIYHALYRLGKEAAFLAPMLQKLLAPQKYCEVGQIELAAVLINMGHPSDTALNTFRQMLSHRGETRPVPLTPYANVSYTSSARLGWLRKLKEKAIPLLPDITNALEETTNWRTRHQLLQFVQNLPVKYHNERIRKMAKRFLLELHPKIRHEARAILQQTKNE